MPTGMAESLTLVGAWLQSHAPTQFASLRPPISEADLAVLRAEGVESAELIALLQLHDGCDRAGRFFLFPEHVLLSAREIVSFMRSTKERRLGFGTIPFAVGSSGNGLSLDVENGGRVVVFDVWLGLDGEEAYVSLPNLIDDLARSLTTGSPLRYSHSKIERVPVCVDQELRWEVVAG